VTFLFGLSVLAMGVGSAPAWARGDSLRVTAPKHVRENLNLEHPRSFPIVVRGFAKQTDDLYVFQEGQEGCDNLQGELAQAQDAQELYYAFDVRGGFLRRTTWDAFREAGRQWACAYLADQRGRVVLHRYVPFTVTAPSIGRLDVQAPKHPRAGRPYSIVLTGFAALTDSLWIYLQHRSAGACRGWYAFHDSTYLPHHVPYRQFVVQGSFRERTSWLTGQPGRYRACTYLVETNAYPERILTRSAPYRVS
jgi:hypothetical protein